MARLNWKLIMLAAAVAAAVLLLLAAPQLQFRWDYHNDEPAKVNQILDGVWNLRHPPLMLKLADWLGRATGRTSPQQLAECGRLLSALAVGLVIACGMVIAALRAGLAAGLGAGALLLAQPQLFEAAHYFKEDALFLAGVLAVLLALFCCERAGQRWPEFFLATALALTVSVKYAGWLMLPLVGLHWWLNRSQAGARRRWGWPLAVFLVLTLVVNAPLLADWHGFRAALGDELYRLREGDYGMPAAHSMGCSYLLLLLLRLPAVLLCGWLFYLGYCLTRCRSTSAAEWIFLGTPVLIMLLLALTAKYSERYLLPVVVMVSVTGLYGPLLVMSEWARARQRVGMVTKIFVALLLVLGGCVAWAAPWRGIYQGFQHDSRAELTAWICEKLPADAVIAEDTYAKLNPFELRERVLLDNFFVADIGSLEELKQMGVTHLVISYDVYHRFVDGSVSPSPNQAADFQRRRRFYAAALGDLKILWQDANADPKALHPGLTLLEL